MRVRSSEPGVKRIFSSDGSVTRITTWVVVNRDSCAPVRTGAACDHLGASSVFCANFGDTRHLSRGRRAITVAAGEGYGAAFGRSARVRRSIQRTRVAVRR